MHTGRQAGASQHILGEVAEKLGLPFQPPEFTVGVAQRVGTRWLSIRCCCYSVRFHYDLNHSGLVGVRSLYAPISSEI
jgi:hypothetical protein